MNFIIMPPKYYDQIDVLIEKTEREIYHLFDTRMKELVIGLFHSKKSDQAVQKIACIERTD